MFEETISVVSIWASMNSWLTPAVLFVVLNIMIGTIAVTSGLVSSVPNHQSPTATPVPAARSPSVLQRLRSINLYRSAHQPPSDPLLYLPADAVDAAAPDTTDPDPEPRELPQEENAVEERAIEGEEEEEEGPTMEEVFSGIQQGTSVYGRSKSDGGDLVAPRKVPKRIIKKAASDVSSSAAVGEFETADPVAVKDAEEQTAISEQILRQATPQEEVDGRAEDFINRFRRQLNLQRLESPYGAGA